MGPVEAIIRDKLAAAFQPERLEVVNESHMHAGHHAGMDGTGETHFRVRIVSPQFSGVSRLNRHRAVNDALAAELVDLVHALAVEPSAPGEPVGW